MATAHVGPGTRSANALTRADRKAIAGFSATTAMLIAFPFILSVYAHARPLSEATCVSRSETYAEGLAEVRDCYTVGVRVAHSVTLLEG